MDATIEESSVQSLVVPLRHMNLVVPQSMVLEVVPMPEVRSVEGGNAWLRGFVEWHGAGIPLVSLENMCHPEDSEEATRTRRLAVVRSINPALPLASYALEIYSIPHPVKLKSSDVQLADAKAECELVSCHVQAAGVKAVVIDFSAVEAKIAEVLPSAS